MIEAKEYFDEQLDDLTARPDVDPVEVATELKQLWGDYSRTRTNGVRR